MVSKESMNKVSSTTGVRTLLPAVVFLFAGLLAASAQDRFSLSVGSRDMLVVQGDHRTELPLPSISQAVIVNGTTFQVSYGRDATGLLTAIIAPNPSEPQDLHFTVLGKSIDSDRQAVVTLTFSKAAKDVKIDPGYVGVVEVNSQKVRPDSAANFPMRHATPDRTATPSEQSTLTDSSAANTSDTVAATVAPAPSTTVNPSVPTAATTAAIPPVAANAPSTVTSPSEASKGDVSDHNPEPMQVNDANQLPFTASATPGPSTVASAGTPADPKQHPLFWAEPITPPSGAPPAVGVNEMKLIEVQGSVSVTPPGGGSQDAQNGMLVPSGSKVSTSTGASAAVFMGGVNSVRLLPNTDIEITQELNGSSRKTVIDLQDGTVFSRVGHRPGETQNYEVATPAGVSVAKGTEFADSYAGGHHYVFVVKGIVDMLINNILTGSLTALPGNLATGAMPPATDGNKILFSALTALQPFQSQLQKILADIKAGTATPEELAYYKNLKDTFTVMVDDVYDPTHPNAFLGAFTSTTGFGDSTHSIVERPQDFATINPNNPFNNGIIPTTFSASAAPAQVFFTAATTPQSPSQVAPITQ
jgi:hypothetical protein